MPSREDLAYAVALGFTPAGGTEVVIGDVYTLGAPEVSRDAVDNTKLDAPGRFRQYMKGMLEGGEMSLQVANDTAEVGLAALLADLTGPGVGTVSITWLDGFAMSFPGFVTKFQPATDAAGKDAADLTIKVAGQITFTLETAA
jgi:hypothetical protein